MVPRHDAHNAPRTPARNCPVCQGVDIDWPGHCHTSECENGHTFPMGRQVVPEVGEMTFEGKKVKEWRNLALGIDDEA